MESITLRTIRESAFGDYHGVLAEIRRVYPQLPLDDHVAPHHLKRSCAKLCHGSGGELDQIQLLLGHVSVQTTERYLGCKQRIRE